MEKTITITRSFSQKIKTGEYLTADFFASSQQECSEKEVEEVSKKLSQICYDEVQKSIGKYFLDEKEEANKLWQAKQKELYGAENPQTTYDKGSKLDEIKEQENAKL